MWWRWDGWPTAAEWQAWWGFAATVVAAILLFVAWKQLSGLAESNSQLARSNELLTESNKAISRPVVVVEYLFERHASRDYSNSDNRSSVYVIIRNVGTSPARDVLFTVSPAFEKVSSAVADATTEFLNELFSGRRPIKMLAPGQTLKYVLDSAREALKSTTLPAEYQITVAYTDLQRSEVFSDEFVLEMSHWGMTIGEVAPLKRLSKDVQFLTQSIRDDSKGLPMIANRVEQVASKISVPPAPRIVGRPRTSGRKLRRGRR